MAYPLVGADHRVFGFISIDLTKGTDWRRSHTGQRIREAENYLVVTSGRLRYQAVRKLPWVGEGKPAPFFSSMHGSPAAAVWLTRDGVEGVGLEEHARRVAYQVSLSGLPQEHPLVLEECFRGMLAPEGVTSNPPNLRGIPDAADPLEDMAGAQHIANETGRPVYATVFWNSTLFRVGQSDPPLQAPTPTSAAATPSGCSSTPSRRARRWTRWHGGRICTTTPVRPPRRTGSGRCGWCGRCGWSSARMWRAARTTASW